MAFLVWSRHSHVKSVSLLTFGAEVIVKPWSKLRHWDDAAEWDCCLPGYHEHASRSCVYQVILNMHLEGFCYSLLGMKIQLKKLLQTPDSTIFEVPRDPQFSVMKCWQVLWKQTQKALGEVESVGQEWAGILALPLVRRLFYCSSEAQLP